MSTKGCRFCGTDLRVTFCDLGMTPLSNSFLVEDELQRMEKFYPLHAYVCESCLLVQLEKFESPEQIFTDYAYFSSYSETWLAHAKAYAEQMVNRLGLSPSSRVVEIASNDGYLLQYFQQAGIPVLGIEPAENVARVAVSRSIPTLIKFFGAATARTLASEGISADLLIGNNVLAHVPDLNDFVAGMKILLAPSGTISMEFPHLLRLIAGNQFDTVYHEHFSYFSLTTAVKVFEHHGLSLCDVTELSTHGGSLRIHARHSEETGVVSAAVTKLLSQEQDAGLTDVGT